MKKLLLAILVLVVCVSAGSVCFAATGTGNENILDEGSVGAASYTEELADEGAPQAGVDQASGQQQITLEEEVPKALPKTGGIPAEAFYVVGALLIAGALVLSIRKAKPASK
jgi:LPXTG-motif cell wall-anchored protein